MDFLDVNSIPGYREAVEIETRERELAFLKVNPQIQGVEVVALTPMRLQILRVVKSPFIVSNPELATLCDVAIFLWVVSPQWRVLDSWFAKLQRWMFVKRIGVKMRKTGSPREALTKFTEAIKQYIADSFADAPGSSDTQSRSYWSFTASLTDRFANEYGWTQEYTENKSFRELFQLIAVQRKRNDPKAACFNRSDKVIGKFLADLQREADAKRSVEGMK